jgi:hypothetical protein
MPASRTIAAILGPTLGALAASEALNLSIWAQPEPQIVYLNGTVLLVAGLAIIRTHNVWTWRWPLLITVVGWAAAAAGLYRMFAPRGVQLHESPATFVLLMVLGVVGLVLTVLGWRR